MMFLMENASGTGFGIFYVLFCARFVIQSTEFKEAGISPERILSSWIISRDISFLEFHLKLSVGTVLIHSCLPLGFSLGHAIFSGVEDDDRFGGSFLSYFRDSEFNQYFLQLALLSILLGGTLAFYWIQFQNHPLIIELSRYANRDKSWKDIALEIDTEYRRLDKVIVNVSPISQVIVTDNWFLHVGQTPWSFKIIHQSDLRLDIVKSDHHSLSTDSQPGGTQYLTITATNRKPQARPFNFRINSLEYQNLQGKVSNSLFNNRNIQIFRSVSDRFVEVFEQHVNENPSIPYESSELQLCMGCAVNTANVKLVRRCGDVDSQSEDPCVICNCRPWWCIGCMARWFASRQNQKETETWLGSKCPCPTCRSKFCILDVCLISPT